MKKARNFNVLFCGIGGQGVLKAAEVLGLAAVFAGYHVKKTEVHGMAQRGGAVESHLRFGKKVYSPLIPKGQVDFLVPFYKEEGLRLKEFLKPKGLDFVAELEKAQRCLGDRRYINTFLLGQLSKCLPIKQGQWLQALEAVFLHKDLAENKTIFLKAREE